MAKLILMIALSGAVLLTPVMADARGGGWHGFGAGLCIGLPLGCLLARPAVAAPPPPPPPPTCYRQVPEHWETRWDPHAQRYYSVYHPPSVVPYPCP